MSKFDTVLQTGKEMLKKDVDQFNKLDQNRKVVLLAFLGGLFVLSVIVGSRVARRQPAQNMTGGTGVVPTEIPARVSTDLAISTEKKDLKVGEEIVATVHLSNLAVPAADIVLQYDPSVLAISNVTNGDVFAQVIRNSVKDGLVTFSGSVNPADKDNLRAGIVFTFTIKPLKASASTSIMFDPLKTITALDGDNTLGGAVGGLYTVVN